MLQFCEPHTALGRHQSQQKQILMAAVACAFAYISMLPGSYKAKLDSMTDTAVGWKCQHDVYIMNLCSVVCIVCA